MGNKTNMSAPTQRGRAKAKGKEGARACIFISYSHAARNHMLVFRRHLEGLLFGKADVWSDHAIPRGEKWETDLLAHLKKSHAALVLVTPDFLSSEWCRRELSYIDMLNAKNSMKKVFWVQVEPSGWQGTELARFQSWKFNLNEALTAISDSNKRERAIVKICEDIRRRGSAG